MGAGLRLALHGGDQNNDVSQLAVQHRGTSQPPHPTRHPVAQDQQTAPDAADSPGRVQQHDRSAAVSDPVAPLVRHPRTHSQSAEHSQDVDASRASISRAHVRHSLAHSETADGTTLLSIGDERKDRCCSDDFVFSLWDDEDPVTARVLQRARDRRKLSSVSCPRKVHFAAHARGENSVDDSPPRTLLFENELQPPSSWPDDQHFMVELAGLTDVERSARLDACDREWMESELRRRAAQRRASTPQLRQPPVDGLPEDAPSFLRARQLSEQQVDSVSHAADASAGPSLPPLDLAGAPGRLPNGLPDVQLQYPAFVIMPGESARGYHKRLYSWARNALREMWGHPSRPKQKSGDSSATVYGLHVLWLTCVLPALSSEEVMSTRLAFFQRPPSRPPHNPVEVCVPAPVTTRDPARAPTKPVRPVPHMTKASSDSFGSDDEQRGMAAGDLTDTEDGDAPGEEEVVRRLIALRLLDEQNLLQDEVCSVATPLWGAYSAVDKMQEDRSFLSDFDLAVEIATNPSSSACDQSSGSFEQANCGSQSASIEREHEPATPLPSLSGSSIALDSDIDSIMKLCQCNAEREVSAAGDIAAAQRHLDFLQARMKQKCGHWPQPKRDSKQHRIDALTNILAVAEDISSRKEQHTSAEKPVVEQLRAPPWPPDMASESQHIPATQSEPFPSSPLRMDHSVLSLTVSSPVVRRQVDNDEDDDLSTRLSAETRALRRLYPQGYSPVWEQRHVFERELEALGPVDLVSGRFRHRWERPGPGQRAETKVEWMLTEKLLPLADIAGERQRGREDPLEYFSLADFGEDNVLVDAQCERSSGITSVSQWLNHVTVCMEQHDSHPFAVADALYKGFFVDPHLWARIQRRRFEDTAWAKAVRDRPVNPTADLEGSVLYLECCYLWMAEMFQGSDPFADPMADINALVLLDVSWTSLLSLHRQLDDHFRLLPCEDQTHARFCDLFMEVLTRSCSVSLAAIADGLTPTRFLTDLREREAAHRVVHGTPTTDHGLRKEFLALVSDMTLDGQKVAAVVQRAEARTGVRNRVVAEDLWWEW